MKIKEKKQVEAIQNNKQLVNINKDDYKDKILLSKERKIFKDISNKKLNKIEELNNKIDYDDLDYVVLSRDMEYNFSIEKDPISLLKAIKDGEISLKEARDKQKNYLQYLNIIRKGHKNSVQKKPYQILKIILMQERERAIKYFEEYSTMVLEARILAKEQEGEGANEILKILTPNQMLKRLPIALAQVKAGNNSETLLNEIRQIVYSLYRSKEITKKVYNNIINPIKV